MWREEQGFSTQLSKGSSTSGVLGVLAVCWCQVLPLILLNSVTVCVLLLLLCSFSFQSFLFSLFLPLSVRHLFKFCIYSKHSLLKDFRHTWLNGYSNWYISWLNVMRQAAKLSCKVVWNLETVGCTSWSKGSLLFESLYVSICFAVHCFVVCSLTLVHKDYYLFDRYT